MKALIYEAFGGRVEVADVPDPVAPRDGAVIRVRASGLCRSDWHAWAGHDAGVSLPQIPGHEFAGVVEAVGDGVTRWHVGDRVTAPFVNGCGRCEWCLSGQAQVCPDQTQPGFTHAGSHAELVVVRAADLNLIALPDGLPFEAAAALGCRFATAFRAVTDRARVRADEHVVVFGAGGVGLSAIMVAAALGARPVAVDPSAEALRLAASLGAVATIEAGDSATDRIVEATGGGAHVSIDAVGSPAIASQAVRSLRRRGRHVQIGLIAGDGPALPLDRVIGWELDVLGSHGMAAADYPAMLELVASGRLDPARLLGRLVGLSEAARMLPLTASTPPVGIAVLDPSSP